MTTEATELLELVKDIPSNYNDDTFEMFVKWIPTLPEGEFVAFGTGLGKAVVAIALLNPKLKITTIDTGAPYLSVGENINVYQKRILDPIAAHGLLGKIYFEVADSRTFPWDKPLVGLNIDSGHSYELTKDEIIRWTPWVMKDGLIFFDDYLIERVGVKQAVDELVRSKPGEFEDLNIGGMEGVYRKLV